MNFFEWHIEICILLLNFSVTRSQDFGAFWHITDIHVDFNYSRFGNAENLCHDEGAPGQSDNGLYGNILCSTPWLLLNLTVASMYSINRSPDFIIWTGDNMRYSKKDYPIWEEIYETHKNITLLFRSIFNSTPIFPSIGNHDTFPPNNSPIGNSSFGIYRGFLEQGGWKELLNNTDASTFEKGGYYSILVKEKLRIISLNTILWHSQNKFTLNIPDPANQFQWLEKVLQNSSVNSEKVYIIGHIPPGHYNRASPGKKGFLMYQSQHLESYLKIILNFTSIIAGQFYGHVHMDMFQIFRDASGGEYKSSSLVAPPVTPWYEGKGQNVSLPVNPSIRLVRYSLEDFELLDYSQYFLNLSKANAEENGTIKYELLYSFTAFYGVEDLTIVSLVELLERLMRSSSWFDKFFRLLTVNMKTLDCDHTCRVAQICAMTAISSSDYDCC